MGIGGVINRPKGQANSPSPFFICWQFLKVGILWKMRFGKIFPVVRWLISYYHVPSGVKRKNKYVN